MQLKDYHFLQQIAALPFVEAIYLFGSRARGDHRERSDIDLAIFCPHANERDWQLILNIVDEADTLLPIDCVRFDHEQPNTPLRLQIEKDKKLIYERSIEY
jgi:Nucleotidyltransferase domain.